MDPDKDKTQRTLRSGDGGVFLVVSDGSSESDLSLRYAARRAAATRGHVAILRSIEVSDFQHWGRVEAHMKREMREDAEKHIWEAAKKVNELTGQFPSLYVREGQPADIIVNIMEQDRAIRQLVLTGKKDSAGLGRLASYFTGKGLGRLRVSVVIIPGHLSAEEIDDMT